MQTAAKNRAGEVAVLLVNNEVTRNAIKGILEDGGFEVRQDIESCREAVVGFIGSYFALLGVVRQVRATNLLLPLVLVRNGEYGLDTEFDLHRDFYDVIQVDYTNEMDIKQKVARWFSEGHGKPLINGG
jgi:hypothetical protein